MTNLVLLLIPALFAAGFLGNGSFARLFYDPDRPEVFRSEEHKELYNQYLHYQKIKSGGGWSEITPGEDESLESLSSEMVEKLTQRLNLTGDLRASDTDPTHSEQTLGEALKDALIRFQNRHGIEPTGSLNERTLKALNQTVDEKVELIRENLKEWESLPEDLGHTHIIVNIPEFTLRAYEDNSKQVEMKVIVGRGYQRETPSFSHEISYVEFFPEWNVPQSIANKDIIPKAREDISYLKTHRYQILDSFEEDAEILENNEESLDLVEKGEARLKQLAGPANSLGLVKFMFPNDYSVYLHDTPEDHLFDREKRDFSSGCIRVEDPAQLAAFLLSRTDESWTLEQAQERINKHEHGVEILKQKVPIHLVYHTVSVNEDGQLQFHPDIYGRYGEEESDLR